jgi:hypothetical protein
LKLVLAKRPTAVMVIDRIERPSENQEDAEVGSLIEEKPK